MNSLSLNLLEGGRHQGILASETTVSACKPPEIMADCSKAGISALKWATQTGEDLLQYDFEFR